VVNFREDLFMTLDHPSICRIKLMRLVAIGGMACVAFALAHADAQKPRPFATSDISALKQISGLEVAPDGSRAVYGQGSISADGRRREQTIWLLDLKKRGVAIRITTGVADTRPKWSTDGTKIAFLRQDASKDITGGQLMILSMKDGKERNLATLKGGTDFSWSPDGQSIAFSSSTQGSGTTTVTLEPGVHIFTRADYRTNSTYLDFRNPTQIWTVNVTNRTVRRLTNSAQPAVLVGWSTNGEQIYYTVNETAEPYYGIGTSGFFEVGLEAGSVPHRLRSLKDPSGKRDLSSAPKFALSPDGKLAAFVAGAPAAPAEFAQEDVFVMDMASGEIRNLTEHLDEDVSGDVAWRGNGELLAVSLREASGNLLSIDVTSGAITPRTVGFHMVHSFSSGGSRLVAVISAPNSPAEVYEVSTPQEQTLLTRINSELCEKTSVGSPEPVWFTDSDGVRFEAFLQKPPGFEPNKKYPMIVWNHGGPFNIWSAGFNADVQAMAGAGYLVLLPNPRGSSSYGQAFASMLSGKWPGGPDYDDVMSAVDVLLQRPYIDKSKLGIAGSSAGGVMTDWAITHTDRFAAAVSISDIANFNELWFIGDQPHLGSNSRIPSNGHGDSRRSPIDYVQNVKTPTLFISGERDYRTPSAAGGELMFRALKQLHIPTALIRFDTAGHSIYTSEYPEHPSLRMHYLLRWMDLHLKGIAAPEFEVVLPVGEGDLNASHSRK
jgi:dipeptidyl aminopeptidase/acylaminoacyl peptidase